VAESPPVRQWRHEFVLVRRLIKARIRSDWQYRVSFIALMTSQAAFTALEFVTLLLILRLVPTIGGWTGAEVAMLYGLSALSFGVADMLFGSVERLSTYVQQGEFDRVLLRPVSPLLQLVALEFELRRAGKMVPPMLVLGWAVANVEIGWTPARALLLVAAVVSGSVIYAALWILSASVSFWAVASKEAANAFTYGGQFANEYPLHLYRNWIRVVLGWAIPLAFVAYVPVQSLLDAANPLGLPSWLVFTVPLVAAGTLASALTVWRTGIRHYQSTGS